MYPMLLYPRLKSWVDILYFGQKWHSCDLVAEKGDITDKMPARIEEILECELACPGRLIRDVIWNKKACVREDKPLVLLNMAGKYEKNK